MTRLLLVLSVAFLFCGCGPSAQDRQVIERLRSRNIAVRMRAISEAEARPNRYFKIELRRIFDDPRELPLVQGAAGITLARMHDEQILERIYARLPDTIAKSSQANVFANAQLYTLGRALNAYGPGALPTLGKLLQNPKPEVVAWAVEQHGSFRRNDAALKVLATYITNQDPRLRRAAASGLTRLYHPGAEALILTRLADPDPEVRAQLGSALANYGTAQSIPALKAQSLKEKDPQVKRSFALALASVQAQAAAVLPPSATSNSKPQAKTKR